MKCNKGLLVSLMLTLSILLMGASGCEDKKRNDVTVWYVPNEGSVDMPQMFMFRSQWQKALSETQVFGFHSSHFYYFTDQEGCLFCGKNVFKMFHSLDVFKKLRDLDLKTSLHFAPLSNDPGCAAGHKLAIFQLVLDRIQEIKGYFDYIVLENPWKYNQACGKFIEFSAKETADFAMKVRMLYRSRFPEHPEPKIGLVETMPWIDPDDLKSWLVFLKNKGWTPAFVHVEADLQEFKARQIGDDDIKIGLLDLEKNFTDSKIPFGITYVGDPADTDEEYAKGVDRWLDIVRGSVGATDHLIVRNWHTNVLPDGSVAKTVPNNLSESEKSSGTGILRHVLDGLGIK